MSWSRRSLLAALALAGCGFAPVHRAGVQGQVAITAPQTPLGYALLDRLEQRLGPPRAPAYALNVTVDMQTDRLPAADHATLVATATWALTGVAEASGTVRHFASYQTDDTVLSLEAAERDAEARLARGLADQIVTAIRAAIP